MFKAVTPAEPAFWDVSIGAGIHPADGGTSDRLCENDSSELPVALSQSINKGMLHNIFALFLAVVGLSFHRNFPSLWDHLD